MKIIEKTEFLFTFQKLMPSVKDVENARFEKLPFMIVVVKVIVNSK